MDTSRTSSYTDLSGLNQLKQLGRKDDAAAIHKVAQQFESMFVSQLLKNMREGNKVFSEDNPLNSSEVEFHQEMYDQQLSLSLSSGGKGIGLADVLERQLSNQYHVNKNIEKSDDKSNSKELLLDRPFAINRSEHASVKLDTVKTFKAPEKAGTDKSFTLKSSPLTIKSTTKPVVTPEVKAPLEKKLDKVAMFDSPEQFIKSLYHHAKAAADSLGVKTEFLLSQAALETGWGKHVMQDKDGKSSHNLFGIKSNGWQGDSVHVSSLESENGVMKPVVSAFRSYDSFKDSFDDYVAFLKNNPRYQQALQVAQDPKKFAEALQESGYASDPDYATKILNIISSGKISTDILNKIESKG